MTTKHPDEIISWLYDTYRDRHPTEHSAIKENFRVYMTP